MYMYTSMRAREIPGLISERERERERDATSGTPHSPFAGCGQGANVLAQKGGIGERECRMHEK